tara:strand:+ start:240 stop:1004 length:765 start_codon:yes stop_codon:yes gene_type:complete
MSIEESSLVYGGSLDALSYAFQKGHPLVYSVPVPPHQFKNSGVDRQRWFALHFLLGTAGLLPLSTKVSSARLTDNMLGITTTNSRLYKIIFEKLYVVDSDGLDGLPVPTSTSDEFEVLDWINVRSGMIHPHDAICGDLVDARFYLSKRIDGNHNKKDACVISRLNKQQLSSFEHSEAIMRLKLMEEMQSAGIKGTGNGAGRHLSIKLESSHRQIFPLSKNTYEDVPHVEFVRGEVPFLNSSECPYLNRLAEQVL